MVTFSIQQPHGFTCSHQIAADWFTPCMQLFFAGLHMLYIWLILLQGRIQRRHCVRSDASKDPVARHTRETQTNKKERRFITQQPRNKMNTRCSEWSKKPTQNQGRPKIEGRRHDRTESALSPCGGWPPPVFSHRDRKWPLVWGVAHFSLLRLVHV